MGLKIMKISIIGNSSVYYKSGHRIVGRASARPINLGKINGSRKRDVV